MDMKNLVLILTACLLCGCASQRHQVVTECEVVYRDTTHLQIVTDIIDTAHVVETTKERVRVVEHYDPTTGLLAERVTDSERDINSVRDLFTKQAQRIEELEAALRSLTDSQGETIKEPPKPSFAESIGWGLIAALALLATAALLARRLSPR